MNSLTNLIALSDSSELISIGAYALNIIAALGLGTLLSYIIQLKNSISKSFSVTLAILPAVVCVVIMMVNGSIGTGVAVAGAFSLIRFRSVPGSGREIMSVFIAMAIGLTCGMGNLIYALIFTGIAVAALILLERLNFGEKNGDMGQKALRITIPEDLDYSEVFEDLFVKYTRSHKLTMVKTTNLGSLFKLYYDIEIADPHKEKEFIDQLRVRNGNLEISCSMMATVNNEL